VSISDTTPYDPNLAQTLDAEDDAWDDAPIRPRARLSRVTKLLLVLAVGAAAFAGGVFAQRHWGVTSSNGSSGSGAGAGAAARRFAGLGGGSGAGRSASGGRGFGGATIGQVAYLNGTTLYVTDTSGNTVKVKVPKGTPVMKSVTAGIGSVRPGDTVVVRGSTAANGTVTAQSVSVGGTGLTGGAGGFGGGGAAGFGGSGSATEFGGSNG